MHNLSPIPEPKIHGESSILAKAKRNELKFEMLPTTGETEFAI